MTMTLYCALQVVAIVLLSLGCSYLLDTSSMRFNDIGKDEGLSSLFYSPPVIICVIGVITFLVALLACFAAYGQKRFALIIVS